MKFIRLLSTLLLLLVALAAILVVALLAPAVQTWIARTVLDRQPGLHGSLGELSARFGKVEIADLHLEFDGAVLTLPSVEVRLPLTTALWNRKAPIRSLIAKGWTLDLSRRPAPAGARAHVMPVPEGGKGTGSLAQVDAAPAQKVVNVLRGILSGWKLPCEVSLDGIELEGDVLVALAPGNAPAKVHVIVKGGGVAAGHEGALALDATGTYLDSNVQVVTLAAHGRLILAVQSPRTLRCVEIKADLSAKGGSLPEDLALSVDVAAARGRGEGACTLDLSRGSRHLATVLAHSPEPTGRLVGTWKIDLRDSDLAPFAADRLLPSIAAAGEGDIDADVAFTRVHALGRLNVVASHLGVLAPPLDPLGTVTLDARFDLAHSGQSIRVDRLSVSLAGARPAAVAQSLQSFDIDERTGNLTTADPSKDWMEATFGGLPLTWLSGITGGFTFVGGEATGEFVARAANGGFALRPKTPFTATGVSVQRAGRMVGRGLDLSLSLLADYTAEGWQVQWAPLTVGSAGRRLATIEAKGSWPAEAGHPFAIAGTWNADLEALASQHAIPGLSWITAHSASGDLSASVGTSTKLEGKVVVVGKEADQSITVNVRADVGADHAVAFRVPAKITWGSGVSEVSAEGTWISEKAGSRIDVALFGKNAVLEHLRVLAAPLAAIGGAPLSAGVSAGTGGPRTPARGRDRIPFWGDWFGRVTVAFDRLRVGDDDFDGVRGNFDLDHGSIRLANGVYGLPDHGLAKVEGSISFDPAADSPYSLKATAAGREIDAAPLFGAPPPGQEPVFHGRFTVASTLTGNGMNLDDLIGRTRQEFRLTSKGGIVRLLKTSVAESIPEPSTPVANALGTVGSLVGPLLGLKRNSIGSGETHLSKNTEAVLNFTYQIAEIGYDQITITAIRGSDRTIHLVDIAMAARDEHVTGSGQITHVKGLSLFAEPLSVDLQFGARGKLAELLSTAGLLSSQKDDKGYTMLNQPIHFGGTLQHIDDSQWHDLLAKAAVRKPDGGKKGGNKSAGKK